MAIDFGTTGSFSIGGTTVLTVNSGGAVTMPLQPAFHVMAGSATTAGNTVIPAGTQMFNIGSCYNSTNGRFTCPVAGKYYFKYHQLLPYATTGRFDVLFTANGIGWGGTRFIIQKDTANTWRTIHTEFLVSLNVNDFVAVYYATGGAALYTDANYGAFQGYKVA